MTMSVSKSLLIPKQRVTPPLKLSLFWLGKTFFKYISKTPATMSGAPGTSYGINSTAGAVPVRNEKGESGKEN